MLLLITFPNETMPFIEDGLSEEECIRAINKAKELGWEFQENRYVVESDRIIIHAWKRNPTRETRKKKRYYIFGDKVLFAFGNIIGLSGGNSGNKRTPFI